MKSRPIIELIYQLIKIAMIYIKTHKNINLLKIKNKNW